MRVCAFLSLLLLSTLLAISMPLQVNAISTWNAQTVDKSGAKGELIMALDSNKYPHIAYNSYEGDPNSISKYSTEDLTYASWNGGSWSRQKVTQDAYCLDFKLDSNNNPHILCRDAMNGSLMYASCTGTKWSIQTIDRNGFWGSLSLDSYGNPHIAYLSNGSAEFETLKYASWTGLGWQRQIVDGSLRFPGYLVSLALDSSNNPHVMYEARSSSLIKYAVKENTTWNIQTVFENASLGNMVLDSNGYPHLIFENIDIGNLTYANWDGTAWSTQVVGSNVDLYQMGSVTLDSNNYPYITYSNGGGYNGEALMYKRWTGSTWETQTADPGSATGPGTLIIDSNGNLHLSYPGFHFDHSFNNAYCMFASTANYTRTASLTMQAYLPWIILLIIIVAVVLTPLYLLKRKKESPR